MEEITDAIGYNTSPTGDKDFIYVEAETGSDERKSVSSASSSKKSTGSIGSSFADVLSVDFEPKMTHDHGEDVSKLVAEAQMDHYFPNYYAENQMVETDGKNFQTQSEPSSSSSDEEHDIKRTASESHAKDACVMFHNITYLGSSTVSCPASELELRQTMSILREHTEVSIDVILSISLSPHGELRLIDPESRTDIASYSISNLCFWSKGDTNHQEKDCLAFTISHGKEDPVFHCHVFKCEEEEDVSEFRCIIFSIFLLCRLFSIFSVYE